VLMDGKPLAQMHVRASRSDGYYGGSVQALTDAGGRYRLEKVPPGMVNVRASFGAEPGQVFGDRTCKAAVVENGATTTVDFYLTNWTASVEGVLEAPAAASKSLELWIENDAGTSHFRTSADKDGAYRFESVPAGSARLRIARRKEIAFDIAKGETSRQDIHLDASAGIEFSVRGLEPGEQAHILLLGGDTFVPPVADGGFGQLRDTALAVEYLKRDEAAAFEHIDPGTYTIVGIAFRSLTEEGIAQARVASQVVHLDEDDTTSIDFDL